MDDATYIQRQQMCRQWGEWICALGEELAAKLDTRQLQEILFQAGVRMASKIRVPACNDLSDIASFLNDYFAERNWGWVRLNDSGDRIVIEHHHVPLRLALGEEAMSWAASFLEGFYTMVFRALGAEEGLGVRLSWKETRGTLVVLHLVALEQAT